ncbi:hypothetical protein MBLNU457_g2502t1 [Dothideomycetes sp. NU457]
MATDISTPPRSRASSDTTSLKRRHSPNLSLDLSDMPGLSTPSQPSNTLIITNLNTPLIFTESNLASIRTAIAAQGPIYSFSPLKSFRRILVTFHSTDTAIAVRQSLDGESVFGERIRVYFGQETDIAEKDNHLSAPEAKKLFFISPPPSPPVGWCMRDEEPPNREVHAEDLAGALARVGAEAEAKRRKDAEMSAEGSLSPVKNSIVGGARRSRSSTLVFDPEHHSTGSEVDLPAIAVEDYADDDEEDVDMEGAGGKPMVHTARPPVELMEE